MGYMVTKPGGATDTEYEWYTRLLRQSGRDLGHLPRVPDPETAGRWACVWPTEAEARAFAAELAGRMGCPGWQVRPVTDAPTVGPFGPVVIQLWRQGDGFLFALQGLSKVLIRSACPKVRIHPGTLKVGLEEWDDYQKIYGGFDDLCDQLIPILTGLTLPDLETLGYLLLDMTSERRRRAINPPDLRPLVTGPGRIVPPRATAG